MFSTAFAFGQQEEDLIKKVLAEDTQGWLDASQDMATNWHMKPYSALIVSSTVQGDTWTWLPNIEDIKQWMGQEKDKKVGAKLTQSNHYIRISGDIAFALFDQMIAFPDKDTGYSKELRILEKIDGEWKITVTSAHFYNKQ